MGTATDPYQRAEGRYKLMPQIISSAHRLPEPVLDPHQGHADPARPRRCWSKPRRSPTSPPRSRSARSTRRRGSASEPGTPHPRKRMEAVAALNAGRHPVRRHARADPAGHHRSSRPAPRGGRGLHRGRRHARVADPAAPASRRPRGVHAVARASTTRTWSRATSRCTGPLRLRGEGRPARARRTASATSCATSGGFKPPPAGRWPPLPPRERTAAARAEATPNSCSLLEPVRSAEGR